MGDREIDEEVIFLLLLDQRAGEGDTTQDSRGSARGRGQAGQCGHEAKAQHSAPFPHSILQVGYHLSVYSV